MGRRAISACHLTSCKLKRSTEVGYHCVGHGPRRVSASVYFGLELSIHGNSESIGAQTASAQARKEKRTNTQKKPPKTQKKHTQQHHNTKETQHGLA